MLDRGVHPARAIGLQADVVVRGRPAGDEAGAPVARLVARAVGVDLDKDIVGSLAEKKGSDLTMWDSAQRAAKSAGQSLKVQAYTPVPLAPKDPDALVVSLMMVPLFVGGYVSASMVRTATGTASGTPVASITISAPRVPR